MATLIDDKLIFDAGNYRTLNISLDGKPMEVCRYEIVYVGKPVAMAAVQPPKGVGPNGELPAEEGHAVSRTVCLSDHGLGSR